MKRDVFAVKRFAHLFLCGNEYTGSAVFLLTI